MPVRFPRPRSDFFLLSRSNEARRVHSAQSCLLLFRLRLLYNSCTYCARLSARAVTRKPSCFRYQRLSLTSAALAHRSLAITGCTSGQSVHAFPTRNTRARVRTQRTLAHIHTHTCTRTHTHTHTAFALFKKTPPFSFSRHRASPSPLACRILTTHRFVVGAGTNIDRVSTAREQEAAAHQPCRPLCVAARIDDRCAREGRGLARCVRVRAW